MGGTDGKREIKDTTKDQEDQKSLQARYDAISGAY